MVLMTPLFRTIKEKYPDAEIDVLASRRNFNVIQNNPRLNRIIVYEKSPLKFLKSIKEIRQKEYDYLIDPKDHYSRESRILARYVKAKKKIGFNPDGMALYDISIPSDKDNAGLHCIQRFINSLKSLSISISGSIHKPELFTTTDSDEYVRRFLNEHNLNSFILINISATSEDRMFSIPKWIDILADYKTQKNLVIIFAPDEKVAAQQISELLPNLILFSTRSINDVISITKKASMLITVDTALVHFASAFNTPILSFHVGNEEQVKKYYPLSDVAIVMKSSSPESGIESINTGEIKYSLTKFLSINQNSD